MEARIIQAIKIIRSVKKLRVSSQNIYRHMNTGSTNLDVDEFHKVLRKLESDKYIINKKRTVSHTLFLKIL